MLSEIPKSVCSRLWDFFISRSMLYSLAQDIFSWFKILVYDKIIKYSLMYVGGCRCTING